MKKRFFEMKKAFFGVQRFPLKGTNKMCEKLIQAIKINTAFSFQFPLQEN